MLRCTIHSRVSCIARRPLTPGDVMLPLEEVAANSSLLLAVEQRGRAQTLRIVS